MAVGVKRGPRTGCVACCPACGRHFAGDSAFDAHRAGPAGGRWCVDPAEVARLVVKTEAGSCGLGGVVRVGVVVWALVGWDRVSAEFAA